MVPVADERNTALILRQRHTITGIVQGVGFRPFIYRLAHELGLSGWVRNSPAGVELEVQGPAPALASFAHALTVDAPPLAVLSTVHSTTVPVTSDTGFTILPSGGGSADIRIAPDSAVCQDCIREMLDPADRRYRYPFITCTNCGPRYSIITGTPYDRPQTTMAGFPLCPDCLREYQDPLNRRFHAQPIACHACGPQLTLLSPAGDALAHGDTALMAAITALSNGGIVAVKGIGGYHLAADAGNHDAVRMLRDRKKRDEKPFAVMAASLEEARKLVIMSDMEERLLRSPEAPVVIARKRPGTSLSPLIAPGNGWLGMMLPYAPLHHLLFAPDPSVAELQPSTFDLQPAFNALIMTSGNASHEPVAYEDDDALARLSGIADYFLIHNRPIHVRSDDSVLRVFQGKPLFYRRARGYAPRAVQLPCAAAPLLAVGAELKGAVCLASGDQAFLSQHIGDLQNSATLDSFSRTISHLTAILEIAPQMAACDLHPDYLSSRYAEECGLPVTRVQHHHAHLASCMAENSLDGDVIGVIFDGTGFGTDGTIWGGEFLTGGYGDFRRAAHFRPLPLPGGDAAVREPWRMALSYLHQALGDAVCTSDHPAARHLSEQERKIFFRMLQTGINSPLTSSCGRLFDAVGALLNVRHTVTYDGQGGMELEALAETFCHESTSASMPHRDAFDYAVIAGHDAPLQLDFSPMIREISAAVHAGTDRSRIAWRFHGTVAAAATDICLRIARDTGLDRVILSGGVFQNRLLSEMLYTALTEQGMQVYCHRLVPPNDGGIALGQAAIAGRRIS